MASIVKRNNRYCVVYTYKHTNGTLKQKWETFTDLADAKNRKKEVEYKESVGTFVVPQCKTLNDLLPEYVALYGKSKWALSTYQANTALIANYIAPLIGSMKLQDITTRVIEGYYQRLLKYEAADPMCGKRKHQFVSPSTVRSVHKILRSAFEQAVKWELMEKNPCIYATLPKYTSKKRDIWTAETLFRALKVCDDPKLRLCINLSFSCSLRLGELLGLTWDCVDISPESIDAGRASIYINKELQRVDIASLNALENKNVITRFPSLSSRCTTVQVLKSPCSATSFLRNWDSILEKKRANLRSISEPARLRQPPPRSTGAAHARGRAQSIREERRIAAPPVLFALLWVRLLPALYGPFCGPLRPFGGCPWGVTPPARECLPPAPPDTRRRG